MTSPLNTREHWSGDLDYSVHSSVAIVSVERCAPRELPPRSWLVPLFPSSKKVKRIIQHVLALRDIIVMHVFCLRSGHPIHTPAVLGGKNAHRSSRAVFILLLGGQGISSVSNNNKLTHDTFSCSLSAKLSPVASVALLRQEIERQGS